MKQQSLTDGFEKFRKKTRKEQFLEDMETIIPWKELIETIEPFYPNPQGAGRRPVGIERMLRIYCQWPFILTHLWPIKLTHPAWFNRSFSASVDSSLLPA